MTEVPIHKDILGRVIEVGHKVVIPRGPNDARLGQVTKLCPVMVKVRHGSYHDRAILPVPGRGMESLNSPNTLVVFGE